MKCGKTKKKETTLDREKLRRVVIKIIEEIYDFRIKNFMVLLKVIAANSE